jgi:hypothetical protein
MLGKGVKIDPDVTVGIAGKVAPVVIVKKTLKIVTAPPYRFAVMIVTAGGIDKGRPNLIGPMIGVCHRSLFFGRKVGNVKVGMKPTIPINLKIVIGRKSAKLANSGKTLIAGKNGRSELLALYGTIVTTVKTGLTLKIVITVTFGRFQFHPEFPLRPDFLVNCARPESSVIPPLTLRTLTRVTTLTVGTTVAFEIIGRFPINLIPALFARSVMIGITLLTVNVARIVSSDPIVANLMAARFAMIESFVITVLTVMIAVTATNGIIDRNLTVAIFATNVLSVITRFTVKIARFVTTERIRNFATLGTTGITRTLGTVGTKRTTVNLNNIGQVDKTVTFDTLDARRSGRHNRFHPYNRAKSHLHCSLPTIEKSTL